MTAVHEVLWSVFWRSTLLLSLSLAVAGCIPRRFVALRSTILQLGLFGLLLLPVCTFVPQFRLTVFPAFETSSPRVVQDENPTAGPTRLNPQTGSDRWSSGFSPLGQQLGPKMESVPLPDGDTNAFHNGNGSRQSLQTPPANPELSPISSSVMPVSPAAPIATSSDRSPETISPLAGATTQNNLPPRLPGTGWNWLVDLRFVYAAGAVMVLFRLVMGLLSLRHLRRSSEAATSSVWEDDLREYCRVLKITSQVELRVTTSTTTPLTFGWLKPTVVIPAALISASDSMHRRAILLHELTHIQHWDFATRILLNMAQAIHWFQPLVWLLGQRLRATQEDRCDAECSAEFGDGAYSDVLIQIARSVCAAPRLTLAMARTSRLAQRLARIQALGGNAITRMSRIGVGFLLAVGVMLALGLTVFEPVHAQQSDDARQSDSVPSAESVANEPNRDAEATNPRNDEPGDQPQKENAKKNEDASKMRPDVALPRVIFRLKDATTKEFLPKTTVKLRRFRFDTPKHRFNEQVWEVASDEKGIVAVSVPELSDDVNLLWLDVDVSTKAIGLNELCVQQTAEAFRLQTISLWPGMEIETRIFGAAGEPADDAWVAIAADTGLEQRPPWAGIAKCDSNGVMRTRIPQKMPFGLMAESDRGAPFRIVYPAGTEKIRDIHLSRGTIVSGRLMDRDGKPIPNCEIVLLGDDSQAIRVELELGHHQIMHLEFSEKTDEQGRFKFSPMTGSIRIQLGSDERPDRLSRLVPVELDLHSSAEVWVPLMLSPTSTISGTVRLKNGDPAPEVSVSVSIPRRKSWDDITLREVETDAEGHYQLIVPFPVDELHVSCSGMVGNGTSCRGRPVTDQVVEPLNGNVVLKRYVGETLTLDWVMHPDEDPMHPPKKTPVVAPEWQPLADLEAEIRKVRDSGKDDRYVMPDRCLEFEAKHRGTRMAIGAMYYITRASATTSSHSAYQARDRAIEVMKNHYIKHPDIDMVITDFVAGSGAPACEPLLQRLADESPYDYVRATALLELARQRFFLKQVKEVFKGRGLPEEAEEDFVNGQTSEEARELVRYQFAAQRRMKVLSQRDGESLQQSALELLDQVISLYSGVAAPVRQFEGTGDPYSSDGLKLADKTKDETWRIRTPAEAAETLRFQKTRLQVGMKAPEIEGRDLGHQPIRLSQFRGKHVLLTLTMSNSEKKLYAECARTIEAIKSNDFVCVSVIPGDGSGGYSTRSIVEDGKVTWPVIRDTPENDIAHFWCQETFPSAYLIDPQGIIRSVDEGQSMINGLRDRTRSQMRK